MLDINPERQVNMVNNLEDFRKKYNVNLIKYTDFLEVLLDSCKGDFRYPREIRVAKPLEYLANGDFEPAQILNITAPITWHGKEIWTKDCSECLDLDLGYQNGDKRFLSHFKIDAKDKAHAVMGGATGSGKSVAVNSLLYSMFFKYAPWELELFMTDSKIAEFKRYGTEHHIPHIRSIGATEDPGYIISAVLKFAEDMQTMNSAMSIVDTKNLKEFREKTGLVIPRHVLCCDEYQMTIILAKKRSNEFVDAVNKVARLGRACGYHLILTSQEVPSEVKPILTNIPIRMCLKAKVPVSETILGNSKGAIGNVGMGKIHITTDSDDKEGKLTERYHVPYQSPEEFKELGQFLEDAAKSIGFEYNTVFYNEQAKITENDLIEKCKKRELPGSIVLGEPSFVCKTPDRFELEADFNDMENILIYSPKSEEIIRFLKTVCCNIKANVNSQMCKNILFYSDNSMLKYLGEDVNLFTSKFRLEDVNDRIWGQYMQGLYRNLVRVSAEEMAFSAPYTDDDWAKKICNSVLKEGTVTDVMISRVHYMIECLKMPKYIKGLSLSDPPSKYDGTSRFERQVEVHIRYMIEDILDLGDRFISQEVTKEDIPITTLHILGHQRIKGLGRFVSFGGTTDTLKELLSDISKINARMIIYTTNVDEFYDFRSYFPKMILDRADKISGKIRCENYPQSIPSICSVYFDVVNDECYLFKRLSLPTDKF